MVCFQPSGKIRKMYLSVKDTGKLSKKQSEFSRQDPNLYLPVNALQLSYRRLVGICERNVMSCFKPGEQMRDVFSSQ